MFFLKFNVTDISFEQITNLFNFAVKENYLYYCKLVYKQIKGMSMLGVGAAAPS